MNPEERCLMIYLEILIILVISRMVQFEKIAEITGEAQKGRRGGKGISLALFIREHLREKGNHGDYPWHIYSEWKRINEQAGYNTHASYNVIRQRIYVLKRLGLIRRVRTEIIEDFGGRKILHSYYTVVPTRLSDFSWINPVKALYPNGSPY